tara:strand:- start:1058 stop:2620 length:1563 start_codon:yes stop_codon:yes gene_type:complete
MAEKKEVKIVVTDEVNIDGIKEVPEVLDQVSEGAEKSATSIKGAGDALDNIRPGLGGMVEDVAAMGGKAGAAGEKMLGLAAAVGKFAGPMGLALSAIKFGWDKYQESVEEARLSTEEVFGFIATNGETVSRQIRDIAEAQDEVTAALDRTLSKKKDDADINVMLARSEMARRLAEVKNDDSLTDVEKVEESARIRESGTEGINSTINKNSSESAFIAQKKVEAINEKLAQFAEKEADAKKASADHTAQILSDNETIASFDARASQLSLNVNENSSKEDIDALKNLNREKKAAEERLRVENDEGSGKNQTEELAKRAEGATAARKAAEEDMAEAVTARDKINTEWRTNVQMQSDQMAILVGNNRSSTRTANSRAQDAAGRAVSQRQDFETDQAFGVAKIQGKEAETRQSNADKADRKDQGRNVGLLTAATALQGGVDASPAGRRQSAALEAAKSALTDDDPTNDSAGRDALISMIERLVGKISQKDAVKDQKLNALKLKVDKLISSDGATRAEVENLRGNN